MHLQVKDNYNEPTDKAGNAVQMLLAGWYTRCELKSHAITQGFLGRVFDEEDGLDCYWVTYVLGECASIEVLVSAYGEVAVSFDLEAEKRKYRVLLTQWNYQFIPSELEPTPAEIEEAKEIGCSVSEFVLDRIRRTQKYLMVNFNNNEHYLQTHSTQFLHTLVGITHSDIPLEATYWDQKNQIYRFKKSPQVDHLDKNKANNSKFNLFWMTEEKNLVMVDWSVEQKQAFYRDAVYLDSCDRERLVRKPH